MKSPRTDPEEHQNPIQRLNYTFNILCTIYIKQELEDENKIIYIPVAEATEGKTPRLRSKGLNIVPPPRPRAPDIKPPKNAKITNLRTTGIVSFRSLGAKPTPTKFLSAYSCLTL
jgi:hypothetical protein